MNLKLVDGKAEKIVGAEKPKWLSMRRMATMVRWVMTT